MRTLGGGIDWRHIDASTETQFTGSAVSAACRKVLNRADFFGGSTLLLPSPSHDRPAAACDPHFDRLSHFDTAAIANLQQASQSKRANS
jgi:hypothetical protein